MFIVSATVHFDAAHHIVDYIGKCSQYHGHRWDVKVSVSGKELNSLNMVVDFKYIKGLMESILEVLDHNDLNQQLHENHPTAEFLAQWIYDEIHNALISTQGEVRLESIEVWESPECSVIYKE